MTSGLWGRTSALVAAEVDRSVMSTRRLLQTQRAAEVAVSATAPLPPLLIASSFAAAASPAAVGLSHYAAVKRRVSFVDYAACTRVVVPPKTAQVLAHRLTASGLESFATHLLTARSSLIGVSTAHLSGDTDETQVDEFRLALAVIAAEVECLAHEHRRIADRIENLQRCEHRPHRTRTCVDRRNQIELQPISSNAPPISQGLQSRPDSVGQRSLSKVAQGSETQGRPNLEATAT